MPTMRVISTIARKSPMQLPKKFLSFYHLRKLQTQHVRLKHVPSVVECILVLPVMCTQTAGYDFVLKVSEESFKPIVGRCPIAA